ncbi:MAG: sigma-70 family RNA polymerase sigma factor [Chloroflexota bacterium]
MSLEWPSQTELQPIQWVAQDSKTLIDIFQNGSENERQAAFTTIYNRYSRPIWDFIYSRTDGIDSDAKDIFSQVWLVAYEDLFHFQWCTNAKSADPLRAWLFQCAANRIKQFHREKYNTVSLDAIESFIWSKLRVPDAEMPDAEMPDIERTDTEEIDAIDSPVDVTENDDDLLLAELFMPGIQHAANETLYAAARKLTTEQRIILRLRHDKNFSFAEIGEYLGKTQGAVKVQHHRTLKKLRAFFDKQSS